MACRFQPFSNLTGAGIGGTWTDGGGVSWEDASGTALTGTIPNDAYINPDNMQAGTYSVTYNIGGGTCTDTETFSITINNKASAGTPTSMTVDYCVSDSTTVNLFSLLTGADTDGVWSGTGTASNGYSAGANPVQSIFVPSQAGNGVYTFTYTVVNSNTTTPSGCDNCTDTATFTIEVTDSVSAGTRVNPTITLCNNL